MPVMEAGLEHISIEATGHRFKEISGQDLAARSQPALGQKAPGNRRGRRKIEKGTAQSGMLR